MSSEKGQLGAPKRLRSSQDVEDFEQEVDQFLLASVASGYSDAKVGDDRAVLLEFSRFLARPLWTAEPADADRFLALQRRNGLARSTVVGKVGTLAQFYDFLLLRYQGDIHALTGYVVVQPIDEYNRPAKAEHGEARVPLRIHEVQALFDGWRQALPQVRKYLPAARDYLAASLWRRAGLRINETVMLDIRDWPSDLGEFGKLHVRFGKGSRGRGVRPRMAPGINGVAALLEGWLPAWEGRLTPHGLRHFCASSLYLQGMDLKAIQELLGHEWLSTTTRNIHVHNEHIEQAWATSNQRVAARLVRGGEVTA